MFFPENQGANRGLRGNGHSSMGENPPLGITAMEKGRKGRGFGLFCKMWEKPRGKIDFSRGLWYDFSTNFLPI